MGVCGYQKSINNRDKKDSLVVKILVLGCGVGEEVVIRSVKYPDWNS